MRLLDRFTTLLRADAHGVVDALEDRGLVVRQALRDAEAEIDRKRARLAVVEDEARHLAEHRERIDRELEALDADVELALAEGQEELARHAIRRLLPLRDRREENGLRRHELDVESKALAERLRAQEEELHELRDRAKSVLSQRRAGESTETGSERDVSETDVELELLRRTSSRQPAGTEGGS